jgi:hypothetical protein
MEGIMDIKKNLKEGIEGDIVGGIIIACSIISVFIPSLEIGWPEAVIGIACGAGLAGLTPKIKK